MGDGLHIHDVFAMAIGKLPSEQIMEQVGKPSGQIMEQEKLDEGDNHQTIESLEERKTEIQKQRKRFLLNNGKCYFAQKRQWAFIQAADTLFLDSLASCRKQQ